LRGSAPRFAPRVVPLRTARKPAFLNSQLKKAVRNPAFSPFSAVQSGKISAKALTAAVRIGILAVMNTLERLIAVADAYIEATRMKPSTVSFRFLGHTTKLQALRNGSGFESGNADGALRLFVSNWPEGEPLPAILVEWCKITFPQDLQDRAESSADFQPKSAASGDQV
jgi:hypothetical protein